MTERDLARAAFDAAVAAADPRARVVASCGRARAHEARLRVGELFVAAPRGVTVLGAGKAAVAMAAGALQALSGLVRGGLVVAPADAHGGSLDPIEVRVGAHPVPTQASFDAGRALLQRARATREDDVVLFLLSGGASALADVPRPPLTDRDLGALGAALLGSGAPIEAVNTVRRHASLLKGGGLRRAMPARTVVTLVLSDVLDRGLEVVGSGPTIADESTMDDVRAVFARWPAELPARVATWLATTNDGARDIARPEDVVLGIGDARMARHAAWEALDRLGCDAVEDARFVEGEARDAGRDLFEQAAALPEGRAIVRAGETTVTVRGRGVGGRNQELALAFALLAEQRGDDCWLAALATDGRDGPTDAAGAFVDRDTAARARSCGVDPARALDENDAYRALDAAQALVRTGSTGTNVNDLFVLGRRPRRRDDT